MAQKHARVPLKIAAIYAVIGCLWIIFSDRAVGLFTRDPELITSLSIAKGWVYILLTALLLYWLIQRYVTAVRLSQDELNSSEEKFSRAFNQSPVLMTISAVENGCYLEVNERFCQVSGFSRQEAIGRTSVELGWISAADRERLLSQLRRDNRISDLEIELTAKDGRSVSCIYSAELVTIEGQQRLLSIAQDITERKRAEELLRQSEEKYRRFSSMTTDYLYSCCRSGDGPFVVQWMSGAIGEITGYSVEEIMAWGGWLQIVHPDDMQRVSNLQLSLLPGGGSSDEFRIVRKDGAIRWIHGVCSCERGASPGELVLFGTCQDITERKDAEVAVHKLNEYLERLVDERTAELQRSNEELANFCYAVSHEIMAPIIRLQGFSNILTETCKGPDEISFLAARIANASSQLQAMVDSLLLLTRLSRMELSLQQVNLSEMAHGKAELLLARNPEQRPELVIEPGIKAFADANLLEMCLDNLLANAFKFTGQSSHPRIEFGTCTDSGKEAYFVRDNGAGFDMGYAAMLFEPFQRLHKQNEFPGIGVGLAIVKKIIERHGGEIWADSRVGEGAVFYFTIGTRSLSALE